MDISKRASAVFLTMIASGNNTTKHVIRARSLAWTREGKGRGNVTGREGNGGRRSRRWKESKILQKQTDFGGGG